MQLDWLADTVRDAGLNVVEYDGWATRSDPGGHYDDSLFDPVGLINHHTAGYYYLQHYPEGHWPDSSLDDKCNITIRPNGEVHVLNAGIAYDSGMGAPEIFDAVRSDNPLPDLAGLESTMNGTLHFIDIEVQHLGDGGPIEPAQREALIVSNAAICEQMGWDPRFRVIGHREWAPDRKIDPRWDGVQNPMPGIRQDTLNLLGDDMPAPKDWDTEDLATIKQLLEAHDNVYEYTNVTGQKRRISGLAVNSTWHVDIAGKRAMDLLVTLLLAQKDLLDIDEAEIAAAVLAGLSPDKIADALEAQAGTIVDAVRQELNSRLEG